MKASRCVSKASAIDEVCSLSQARSTVHQATITNFSEEPPKRVNSKFALALRRAQERLRHKRTVIQACVQQAEYPV
jgi:hypothetical protein